MRRWWMAVAVALAASALRAQAFEQVIKDPDGDAVIAKILMCTDCKSGEGKDCAEGAEKGWANAKPCGKCLIEGNFGTAIRYGYDLMITGKLTNAKGEPVKDRFVKLFLPNGWGVKTRTTEAGAFRMSMGATADRKRKEPLMIDLGTHIDAVKGAEDVQFAFYMLPESYKDCSADAMNEEPAKSPAKKADAKKSADKAPKK